MGLIPVRYKKPRRYVPSLIGPQIPRTDLLSVPTSIVIVRVSIHNLPVTQFHSFAIDPNYGKSKPKPRVSTSKKPKITIDWDNLRE